MKRILTFVSIISVLLLLVFLPIFPSKTLLHLSSMLFETNIYTSSLKPDEISLILDTVRNDEEFRAFMSRSTYISVSEYLTYEKAGIIVSDFTPDYKIHDCDACRVIVYTGYTCGAFCGSGITFYLSFNNGRWEIEGYSKWVS